MVYLWYLLFRLFSLLAAFWFWWLRLFGLKNDSVWDLLQSKKRIISLCWINNCKVSWGFWTFFSFFDYRKWRSFILYESIFEKKASTMSSPRATKRRKVEVPEDITDPEQNIIYLVASGDLRLSGKWKTKEISSPRIGITCMHFDFDFLSFFCTANQKCWPVQEQLEKDITDAFKKEGKLDWSPHFTCFHFNHNGFFVFFFFLSRIHHQTSPWIQCSRKTRFYQLAKNGHRNLPQNPLKGKTHRCRSCVAVSSNERRT